MPFHLGSLGQTAMQLRAVKGPNRRGAVVGAELGEVAAPTAPRILQAVFSLLAMSRVMEIMSLSRSRSLKSRGRIAV